MTAYLKKYLENTIILAQSKRWFSRELINTEQMARIQNEYKTPFYTPNIFIRIGLFLFTCFAISSSYGFYWFVMNMIDYNVGDTAILISGLIFGIGCAVVLEIFIRSKNLYRAGVDDALLYAGLSYLGLAIGMSVSEYHMNEEDSVLWFSLISLPILIAAAIRYTDTLVTLAAMFCGCVIYFLLILKLGEIAKLIMPFAFMILAGVFISLSRTSRKKEKYAVWKNNLIMAETFNLILFYTACNYFVIRECSLEFFNMDLQEGQDIPMGWLFWILTMGVPVFYIVWGLKKKDKVFLWAGLLLIGVSVMTFRNYYSVAPPEVALSIAGVVMIILAYMGIKYFRTGKNGITYVEEPDEDNFLKENLEALVIAQTMGTSGPSTEKSVGPGGGDFGGGGSEIKY